jgi:hypothetical protein
MAKEPKPTKRLQLQGFSFFCHTQEAKTARQYLFREELI